MYDALTGSAIKVHRLGRINIREFANGLSTQLHTIVTSEYLQQIESGAVEPSPQLLSAIYAALQIDHEDIATTIRILREAQGRSQRELLEETLDEHGDTPDSYIEPSDN